MARSRNIKPSFFLNEYLAEISYQARLLFIGLWTIADREGRMEDRPKRIKAAIFPYDNVDVNKLLDELTNAKDEFIIRYCVDNSNYIQVVNFTKHQSPHIKEVSSYLPPAPYKNPISTVQEQGENGASRPDSLLLIPDSPLLISDTPSIILAPKFNEKNKDVYRKIQRLTITKEEHEKLVESYGIDKVNEKYGYCENWENLKNYKSLYLTINNWLKKDNTKIKTNEQVKGRFTQAVEEIENES